MAAQDMASATDAQAVRVQAKRLYAAAAYWTRVREDLRRNPETVVDASEVGVMEAAFHRLHRDADDALLDFSDDPQGATAEPSGEEYGRALALSSLARGTAAVVAADMAVVKALTVLRQDREAARLLVEVGEQESPTLGQLAADFPYRETSGLRRAAATLERHRLVGTRTLGEVTMVELTPWGHEALLALNAAEARTPRPGDDTEVLGNSSGGSSVSAADILRYPEATVEDVAVGVLRAVQRGDLDEVGRIAEDVARAAAELQKSQPRDGAAATARGVADVLHVYTAAADASAIRGPGGSGTVSRPHAPSFVADTGMSRPGRQGQAYAEIVGRNLSL